MIHYLPLSMDAGYIDRTIAQAKQRGVRAIQFSHKLCHHAEDVLNNPEHAAQVAAMVQAVRAAGLEAWCWSHEFSAPPEEFLDADKRLRCDDPGLAEHLQKRYARLCTQVLPGLSGVIITFAECAYPVYQDHRVVSEYSRSERTRRLIDQLYDALKPHGVRLAVRDFVYRVDEVEAMGEALAGLPEDVVIMSKAVPHDWHPDYPINPLIGAFPRHEQWVEHDFGLEYEGQHLLPYANVATISQRIEEERRRGAAAWCLRLDRYTGQLGQSALSTPWGDVMLRVAHAVASGASASSVQHQWEHEHFPGAAAWLREATDCVRRTLFPRGQWYGNHSNIPTFGYAQTHLSGGNADRLAAWSGDPADAFNEQAMAQMPAGWRAIMVAEGDAEARRAQALAQFLEDQTDLGPAAEAWRSGAQRLQMWAGLLAAHRRAYFAIRAAEEGDTTVTSKDVTQAIDAFAEIAQAASGPLQSCRLEGRRLDSQGSNSHDRFAPFTIDSDQRQDWANVVVSLRSAAQRAFAKE
ncbi:MAG: hypothetical protein EA401_09510 [Planctomycetota bacterium]|nr:MAG: hypothetical protein EA401_09510 [Planctomycetota bacterium]